MTQQIINIGATPNDGTGDPLRTAFTKVNADFTEVYGIFAISTVSALSTATVGKRALVSYATTTTFGSIVAGGGANVVPVYADGTNWRIG